jgi:hypothetical protein
MCSRFRLLGGQPMPDLDEHAKLVVGQVPQYVQLLVAETVQRISLGAEQVQLALVSHARLLVACGSRQACGPQHPRPLSPTTTRVLDWRRL